MTFERTLIIIGKG